MRKGNKIKIQGGIFFGAIIVMLSVMFPQIDLLAANASEVEVDSQEDLEEADDSREEPEKSEEDVEEPEEKSEGSEQEPEDSGEKSEESEEADDSKEEPEESEEDLEDSEEKSEGLEQEPEDFGEKSEESEEADDSKEEPEESQEDLGESEEKSEGSEQESEDSGEKSEESEEADDSKEKPEESQEDLENSQEKPEELEQEPNESAPISENIKSETEALEPSEIINDEEVIEIYLPAKIELTSISLGMGADIHSEDIIVWNQGELPLNVRLQNAELWMENSRIYDEGIWLELYQAGKKKKTFSIQEGTNKNVTEFVLTENESTEEILDKNVLADGIASSDYVVFRVCGSVGQMSESCIEDGDLKIRLVFEMDYQ